MRTLVTGGAGFLGLHLVRDLLESAGPTDRIVVVDHLGRHGRDAEQERLFADPRVEFHARDLTVPGAFDRIGGGCDRIFHLAALVGVDQTMSRPAEVLRGNLVSEIQVFDWAAEGGLSADGRLIFASTSETYAGALEIPGAATVPTAESVPLVVMDPADPRSAYAVSKLAGECYLLALFRAKGRHAVVARLHNVYGPRMGRSHVIPQVMERILGGESPLVRYGAGQTRAFCHVRDAVRAIRALSEGERVPAGTIVHVGDDRHEIRIAELYDHLLAIAGRSADLVDAEAPRSSPERRCPDISRLRELTGFEPEVGLEEGLRDTWTFYSAAFETRSNVRGVDVAAGAPVEARIALATPVLGDEEARAVARAVRSGWVSAAGPDVDRVPRRLLEAIGATDHHACPVYSGTAAIELALRVSGVRPDDIVLVPELTFAGTINPVLAIGARPVLLDVEEETFGLDPEAVSTYLDEHCVPGPQGLHERRSGRRVAAVLPVHLLGRPCRIEEIVRAAARHGVLVIEDAAEALGAAVGGRPCGTFGDLGVFSFNGNKVITGGSGGLVVSKQAATMRRARHLSTQARVGLPEDAAEWVHDEPGYNFRMTNLNAALLDAQIDRLPVLLDRKREIARGYAEAFVGIPGLRSPREEPGRRSSHWLSAVLVDASEFGINRRELARHLAARGIETRPIFAPLGMQPAFAGVDRAAAPKARRLWERLLCLPSSADLGRRDQDRVIDAVLAAAGCGVA